MTAVSGNEKPKKAVAGGSLPLRQLPATAIDYPLVWCVPETEVSVRLGLGGVRGGSPERIPSIWVSPNRLRNTCIVQLHRTAEKYFFYGFKSAKGLSKMSNRKLLIDILCHVTELH